MNLQKYTYRPRAVLPHETFDHPRYKYRLTAPFTHKLRRPWPSVITDWLVINDTHMVLSAGYAWDGASGPAIDTDNFLRGSLVHDALYQAIATSAEVTLKPWKKLADQELQRLVVEDGMGWWRSRWVYVAVRLFGGAKQKYQPA